ncbi:MAG: DNA-3-methyladenine glycosylase [Candidatus Bathyarchaeota archaeon]|jgi:DNA-3-methyladenine glycosylase
MISSSTLEVLPGGFYKRGSDVVAENLLGKRLIRRWGKATFLEGLIVETEAYFGLNDPASRAYNGVKNYNELMWREPGRIFIYNVHKYWMFNIVAHIEDGVGAVLIRAIEPVKGIEIMKRNRPVVDIVDLTSGPGKLTTALKIDKSINGTSVTVRNNVVIIANNKIGFEIGCSHRIGVKRDLEKKLRFYVKDNRYLSR